jgi:hypothetical protein
MQLIFCEAATEVLNITVENSRLQMVNIHSYFNMNYIDTRKIWNPIQKSLVVK